jgi:adenine/guanine phosphoribosyltransferase-like PRPP-binding protein
MQPHEFWQKLDPPGAFDPLGAHHAFYPAALADGRQLRLPIRPLSDGRHALASLIVNQASFEVVDALATDLAARLAPFAPDIVAGLPTLGLTLAAATAARLGHGRYVPLGTSRKFWYDDAFSAPMSSITTPDQIKRLYVDPRMLPLLRGARVALIDDVISSGASMKAGLAVLEVAGVKPVVIGAAMLQSERWRAALGEAWSHNVVACFAAPMLRKNQHGLWQAPEGGG